MDTLQFIWFILFFVLLIGYAILDGFDLGIGVISLFTRRQEDRDTLLTKVTPFWDGHEVWLLMAGAALFVAFPPVYASLSTAFHGPFTILFLALAIRAMALKLKLMKIGAAWQRPLDLAFGLCSAIPAFLLGVILASILRGLPLDHAGLNEGTLVSPLHPYGLLGGILSLITFALYGAAFGATKTQGDLQNAMRQWMSHLWVLMIVLWICLTGYTLFEARYLFDGILKNAVFDGLFVLFLISILVITTSCNAEKDKHTFLASSVAIICMLGMAGACLFPRMIPSTTDLMHSLTLGEDCASPRTLKITLGVVLAGMPLLVAYHLFVYRCFRGKKGNRR
ncbi:MAG: cytochrome d ubiquinol oxidase subunit II [Planctomycetes bacterium]|nr:cytochrome d ubiquinol oxidase subunit II [Planctomycetota bacterium]